MNLTEAFEVLFKGAKYGAGTIRTWANGVQYQKQGDGKWVEYKGGAKKQGNEEEYKNVKNNVIFNKFTFHGETYELPFDRFPSPPFTTENGLYVFDKEADKNVIFSKIAEDIQENGSFVERYKSKKISSKGKSNAGSNYADDYKKAEIITSSKLDKKQIYKYLAVAGVPKGYKGDVYFTENENSVNVRISNNDIYMKRNIFTEGDSVGVIENESFTIKNKRKYNGTNIFNNQVQNAQKEGFKKITTEAYKSQGWNGYYTWLRLGYKPDDIETNDKYVNEANEELGTNIKSITDLMYSQEGRDWRKESGGAFEGTFDLSENSYSMKTLEEYVKNKNK